MKQSIRWIVGGILFGALVVGIGDMSGLAEGGGHDQGGHDQGKHGEEETVKTDFHHYSGAMAAIEKHRGHVAELIEEKELADIHKAAKPIQLIAEQLNKLAFKEHSGVPRDKLKEVNLASKALAATWAKIDEAGDEGDLAGTKKIYHEMVDLISTLAAVKTHFDHYSVAMAAIEKHRAHVAELIEGKKLAEVHKAAKPIQLIAKQLNKLASKEHSGVPRDKLKEVNHASKALAKTWAKIDEAGDEGDLAGTKKVYHEIVDLINTLIKSAEEEDGHDEHKEKSHKKKSGHDKHNEKKEEGHHD